MATEFRPRSPVCDLLSDVFAYTLVGDRARADRQLAAIPEGCIDRLHELVAFYRRHVCEFMASPEHRQQFLESCKDAIMAGVGPGQNSMPFEQFYAAAFGVPPPSLPAINEDLLYALQSMFYYRRGSYDTAFLVLRVAFPGQRLPYVDAMLGIYGDYKLPNQRLGSKLLDAYELQCLDFVSKSADVVVVVPYEQYGRECGLVE